jgi:type I restriction enzyme S subunit
MKKSRSTKKLDVSASFLETEKVDSNPALVPKLRFPEFQDAGDWESKRLNAICERIMDGTHFSPKTTEGPRPYLTSKNIRMGWLDLSTVSYISEDEHKSIYARCPVKKYDVLLTKDGANTGNCALNTIDHQFSLLSSVAVLRGDPEKVTQQFLYQAIASEVMQSTIANSMSGQAITRITLEKLGNYAMSVPCISEQQRIASCLASLDELIGEQGRKVDALRTHKKGLMQQLFPREGETQPQLRFPEFQDAGDWEEGALQGKTNKIGSGITPTGGERNYKKSGRPFVRSQNVGWGTLILNDIAFIDDATHATFDSTEIKANDVLLNITGASIGRCAVADDRITAGNVNQHVCIIRVKPDELNPFFLNHFLISERGQKQIDSFQAGGNRQGLNFAQIRSFAIPLPPEKREQQHIAACLSSLDDLITAETQKLEALKTHKRGLMQQMFPSPEEAS